MIHIKDARIYTMTEKGIIEKGDILIEKGKIKAIGEKLKASNDYEVIDATNKIVVPGLIDAHCHLGIFEAGLGFEGNDGNEITDPITPHLRAIDGINPMCEAFEDAYTHGVTCVSTGPGSANVIGGQFAIIKTYGNNIDEMIVKEPAAMKIAFGENPKRVYSDQKKSPFTRMATAAMLRESLYKARRYAEKQERANGDVMKMPEYDLKMEALAKVIRKEIPLKAHAHRADDMLTALRIAREFDVDITIDHCTEGHLITDHLVKAGKGLIVGPSLNFKTKVEVRNLTFDTPGILSKAGIKIAIMTDLPVLPLSCLTLCARLAVDSGMDELEALKAITINAAEILGIDDRVGSIKPGKDADISIFDGDPIKDRFYTNVVTLIDGKIVYRK